MRPADVVRRGADYLARHGVEPARPEAETLLMHVLHVDRTQLFLRTEPLAPDEAKAYGRALCRRCSGTPVQHLTGEVGFRRLVLAVRPGVFVPRPETELLVEAALAAIEGRPEPVVVDVGTGTGAIALAIADERRDARVFATDLSPEAVSLARENAVALGLEVEVRAGDLLIPVEADLSGEVDLVVSNPPYVGSGELATAPIEVRADPRLALDGGVETFSRLFDAARSVLVNDGAVAVEIGETQGTDVAAAARAAGFVQVEVRPDLNGRDRIVTGSLGDV